MHFKNLGNGQIEKMCATDESRFNLNHVFFDVAKGHLVATNGVGLVITHVFAEEGDVTGYVTVEAMQAYRKALSKIPKLQKNSPVKLQALADTLVVTDNSGNTQIFKRPHCPETNPFCNYEAVMPKKVAAQPAFCLDIDQLKNLVDSIGYVDVLTGRSRMIAIFPPEDGNKVCLVKTSMSGPVGIIMPIRTPDEVGGWLTTLEQVDARFAEKHQPKVEDSVAAAEEADEEELDEIDEDEEGDDEDEAETDLSIVPSRLPSGIEVGDGEIHKSSIAA